LLSSQALDPPRQAVLPTLFKSELPFRGWLRTLLARGQKNVVAVALALARIAWAVLRRQETFDPGAMALAMME